MNKNDLTIIFHRNEWNWGESIICVTSDGYGLGTVSFTTEYQYDENEDKFKSVEMAVISGLSVHHSRRGRGYGNMILAECENEAIKHGYDEVYLWADPTSEAYKWYKRHNYIETNQMSIIPIGDKTAEEGTTDIKTEPLHCLKKVFPKLEPNINNNLTK